MWIIIIETIHWNPVAEITYLSKGYQNKEMPQEILIIISEMSEMLPSVKSLIMCEVFHKLRICD